MANLQIAAPLVDGSQMTYISEEDSCAMAVELICGDDLRPPPLRVMIEVKTDNGKHLVLYIPNEPNGNVHVTLDGDVI